MATDRLMGLLGSENRNETVVLLPIDKLEYLDNTPFNIYNGAKKDKLIDSIRENGIINPIIVRASKENMGMYSVLSGANRVDACRIIGEDRVKTIIKNNITDEEAMLIVIDTNFYTRGIDEMLPSELAKSLHLRNEVTKRQGKRNDISNVTTSCTLSSKLCDRIKDFKFSQRNMYYYIRLYSLIPELLSYIDNNIISIRAGAELSYLKIEEQEELVNLVTKSKYNVSMKMAERLKQASINTDETIDIGVYLNEEEKVKERCIAIKLSVKEVADLLPTEDWVNAKDIIVKALKFYYSHP